MSIKILGGIARGYPLATPRSDSTRPTAVLIKRKLFDWRQNLEGHTFIDLFAGSGAVGFEALSRGADKVVLNDSMKGAFLTLKKNQADLIKAFKFDPGSISVTNLDAKSWLAKELSYQIQETENCILYFDPPYADHALYFSGLESLKSMGYKGEVWLEADKMTGPKKEDIIRLFCSVTKTVEQGDHFVVVGKVI